LSFQLPKLNRYLLKDSVNLPCSCPTTNLVLPEIRRTNLNWLGLYFICYGEIGRTRGLSYLFRGRTRIDENCRRSQKFNDASQKERDEQRTMILNRLGIKEIRFTNEEVINQTDQVIKRIEAELSKKCRYYSLPPGGGRAGDGG